MENSNLAAVSLLIRLAKAVLTLFFGTATLLMALGNLFDYRSNFEFVRHVLSMDSIYPHSKLKSRAIRSPRAHHAALRLIILWELFTSVLCTKGGIDMLRHLTADAREFHESKRSAIGGLLAGIALFFLGFQVVAGQWYAMWQSKEWNALPDATRLTQYLTVTLMFVSLRNDA